MKLISINVFIEIMSLFITIKYIVYYCSLEKTLKSSTLIMSFNIKAIDHEDMCVYIVYIRTNERVNLSYTVVNRM